MVTQELIQYIQVQLQSGQTRDAIVLGLKANGWQVVDIEAAFQSITPDQSSSKLATKGLSRTFVIIGIVALLLVAGGVFAYSFFIQKDISSTSPSATPTVSISGSPTIGSINAEESVLYSNPEQEYSFPYLTSWKTDSQGTLTVLASSDNPNLEQCEADLQNILACDVLVSTIPYTENTATAPDDQIKEIAVQLAIGNSITPTTLNNLAGYDAPSTTPDGSTYNVLLQGSKNMILVQFPNKKVREDLNEGQLMILNGISE